MRDEGVDKSDRLHMLRAKGEYFRASWRSHTATFFYGIGCRMVGCMGVGCAGSIDVIPTHPTGGTCEGVNVSTKSLLSTYASKNEGSLGS